MINNISRSPQWSSWAISFLISYTSNRKYKQKSFEELLVDFPTDFIHFQQEIQAEVLFEELLVEGGFPLALHERDAMRQDWKD